MYFLAHRFIVLAYMALPVAAVAWAIYRGRANPQERHAALAGIGILFLASAVIGSAASILYGVSLGGIAPISQIALTSYLVAGLLCLLKLLDRIIDLASRALLRVGHGSFLPTERRCLALIIRATILFGVGLPYMIAAALTFHPRVIVTPEAIWPQLGAKEIRFPSTDGLNIVGLWIDAGQPPLAMAHSTWGQSTVILCHSQMGGKTSYPLVAQFFVNAGYNVITFDFRAYGDSDGQLTTFGDTERCDVLGAVQWVRTNLPQRSLHIHAIGMGTGGAALLAAAADPSPAGQSIESMAIVGCYDRFSTLATLTTTDRFHFTPPLPWLMHHIGITLAGIQTGTDLSIFSPAGAAIAVAPRPIMFIHDRRDRIIPFSLGEDLYDDAHAPKTHRWIDDPPTLPETSPDNAINSPATLKAIRKFFDLAVPMI